MVIPEICNMCLTPIAIKNNRPKSIDDYAYHSLPCGKCLACKNRRAKSWVIRLQEESKIHEKAIFLTLTYDDAHLKYSFNGYPTLHKEHFQLFMKKLRKTSSKKLRYYACGEYGSSTLRPHYHAIIFGTSGDLISQIWQHGHDYIGNVSDRSIAYVAGYMCKIHTVPLTDYDDREKEFSLMSKGIGKNYLTPEMIKWHRENDASYYLDYNGKTKLLPRYYRDRIFETTQRLYLNQQVIKEYYKELEQAINECGSYEAYIKQKYYRDKVALNTNEQLLLRTKI